LLYLSTFLKAHRAEYYDRLTAVRENGDWEGWLRFFLRGVAETAEEATATARAILGMRESHRSLVLERGMGVNGLRLLDLLLHYPVVNVRFVERHLDVAFVTASKLLKQLEALGLVVEATGAKRSRRFHYTPYLMHFADPVVDPGQDVPVQTTEAVTTEQRDR
jgi:Fic family protein